MTTCQVWLLPLRWHLIALTAGNVIFKLVVVVLSIYNNIIIITYYHRLLLPCMDAKPIYLVCAQ